jgi:hypothetical protein
MRLSRVLFLLWLAGLLIVAGGCGGDSAAPSFEQASDTPRPTFRATVYFLTDDAAAPIGVRRTIARESPYARDALDALVEGPTAAERRRGISTAIPDQARVVSLTLRSRQRVLAVVNLTGLPPPGATRRRGNSRYARARDYTDRSHAHRPLRDRRHRGQSRWETWDLWTIDGRIVRAETDYERLRGWTDICGGRNSEERKLGLSRCFSASP